MNDLVHYLRYVLCLEIVDVPASEKSCSHFSESSYGGVRNLPTGQEALSGRL